MKMRVLILLTVTAASFCERNDARASGPTPGTVISWGAPAFLWPYYPPGTRFQAIAAGEDFSLALQSDGTVIAWGDNRSGQSTVPPNLSGVIAIAAGSAHSLALQSDGTVATWGDNSYSQSTVPPTLTGIIAIAASGYHSLALKSDGTVVAWGANGNGQSTVPANLTGVIAIAAG